MRQVELKNIALPHVNYYYTPTTLHANHVYYDSRVRGQTLLDPDLSDSVNQRYACRRLEGRYLVSPRKARRAVPVS